MAVLHTKFALGYESLSSQFLYTGCLRCLRMSFNTRRKVPSRASRLGTEELEIFIDVCDIVLFIISSGNGTTGSKNVK